ncbi:MAG: OmpA family protein [Gemmatimonadales bacterium]
MLRQLAVLILTAATASACASKGYVRTQVQAAIDSSQAAASAGDQSVRTDLSQQVAGVRSGLDSVKSDVALLRQDLNGLRDEFGAKIVAMENGMSFAFPITFGFDDASVPAASRPALDRFAQVVQRHYRGSLVTVEGFADPAGSVAYNRALSQDRADNVLDYLVRGGLDQANLRAVGYGETRQVVPGAERDMPGARSNRRVVFVVETADQSGG